MERLQKCVQVDGEYVGWTKRTQYIEINFNCEILLCYTWGRTPYSKLRAGASRATPRPGRPGPRGASRPSDKCLIVALFLRSRLYTATDKGQIAVQLSHHHSLKSLWWNVGIRTAAFETCDQLPLQVGFWKDYDATTASNHLSATDLTVNQLYMFICSVTSQDFLTVSIYCETISALRLWPSRRVRHRSASGRNKKIEWHSMYRIVNKYVCSRFTMVILRYSQLLSNPMKIAAPWKSRRLRVVNWPCQAFWAFPAG
jgi:hypothetical protein